MKTRAEPDNSPLELEQLIRAVYDPCEVRQFPAQVGRLQVFDQPGAVWRPSGALVWWSFLDDGQEPFFSRWYKEEITWLKAHGICPDLPEKENLLNQWHRKQPVLRTSEHLIMTTPDTVAGETVYPHHLHALLATGIGGIEHISWNYGREGPSQAWSQHFDLPKTQTLTHTPAPTPKAFLRIDRADQLDLQATSSYSSLEKLLYYPYQWLFYYQLKLKPAVLLHIDEGVTMKGNLAHRVFEYLLESEALHMDREAQYAWINEKAMEVIRQEGATMLLYGREPERASFIQKLQISAWTLTLLLKKGGWKVTETEARVKGPFCGIQLGGRVDVLLQKGEERALLDLKWSGLGFRRKTLQQQGDLQLVTYAKLAHGEDRYSVAGYYILSRAKLLVRDGEAFPDAEVIAADGEHPSDVQHRIWEDMKQTYMWRMAQIKRGLVEVRTPDTLEEIEEYFGDELLQVMELPQEEARFDDYRTLIGLVE